MEVRESIVAVLDHYPADCAPLQLWWHDSSGFSAGKIWRLSTERGFLCLRQWPLEHPAEERLQFIHAVLWHAAQRGFDLFPLPIETNDQTSYVQHAGHFWQLEPWLAGEPLTSGQAEKTAIAQALETLARFHRAVADFPISDASPGLPRGIVDRVQRLARLREGGLDALQQSLSRSYFPEAYDLGQQLLANFQTLAPAVHSKVVLRQPRAVPLQPCIRDIWREHALFEDGKVTGIIDFGATRVDSVAIDLARLLGSLTLGDPLLWRWGLAAYRQIRDVSSDEIHLAEDYDQLAVLLGGLQWLEWVFVDRIDFPNRSAVLMRMREHLNRMQSLSIG
jgi:Ser/Thr protein kinase RdoA (MazF antagonist)